MSHLRTRAICTGAADGGNGGKGGDIILKATDHFDDLRIYKRKIIKGNMIYIYIQ